MWWKNNSLRNRKIVSDLPLPYTAPRDEGSKEELGEYPWWRTAWLGSSFKVLRQLTPTLILAWNFWVEMSTKNMLRTNWSWGIISFIVLGIVKEDHFCRDSSPIISKHTQTWDTKLVNNSEAQLHYSNNRET